MNIEHLSRAINQLATKGSMPLGSTSKVQILLMTMARALRISVECAPNEEHSRFHADTLSPEGPCAASDFRANSKINVPSI